jgi:hypothetical protein
MPMIYARGLRRSRENSCRPGNITIGETLIEQVSRVPLDGRPDSAAGAGAFSVRLVSFGRRRSFVALGESPCGRGALFDYMVGEQLDRVGHIEAECPGRLQVDDELELARL